jgi:hypothetical protein
MMRTSVSVLAPGSICLWDSEGPAPVLLILLPFSHLWRGAGRNLKGCQYVKFSVCFRPGSQVTPCVKYMSWASMLAWGR